MEMRNFANRLRTWHADEQSQESNAVADRLAQHLLVPSSPDEQPGPDGIRWGLVNRVRAEIAAGVYDDDEKWAMAQELMFQRVGR